MSKVAVSIEEILFRRAYCTPLKNFMNPDGSATSRVFKLRDKDNGELSVDISSLTTKEKSVGDPNRFILFEFENKIVNELKLNTYKDPLPDGANDAHAVIVGMDIKDDVTPGKLAKASRRILFSPT